VGKGVGKGALDRLLLVADAPGGQDLEGQARARGLAHGPPHARGVLLQVDLGDGDGHIAEQGLEFFAGAVALVDAGHVEIEVPSRALDVIDHCGHVRGHAHLEPGVADARQEIPDMVEMPTLEQAVGYLAVIGHGDGARRGQALQGVGVVGVIPGQGDVLQRPAALAVLAVEVEVAGARLPGVDPLALAVVQHLQHALGGKVAAHVQVEKAGEVGAAVDGVGPHDEAGEAIGAQGDLGHGGGRRGRVDFGHRRYPLVDVLRYTMIPIIGSAGRGSRATDDPTFRHSPRLINSTE